MEKITREMQDYGSKSWTQGYKCGLVYAGIYWSLALAAVGILGLIVTSL